MSVPTNRATRAPAGAATEAAPASLDVAPGGTHGARPGSDGGTLPGAVIDSPALGIPLPELEHAPVALDRALAIGAAVARALTVLHESGSVHLNLRPQHVLFDPPQCETVSLAGLDLAVRASWEQPAVVDRAAWQAAAGLPSYAAPELCGRVNSRIDERSDLYSLGCILFELLQGRPPFQQFQSAADLVHAHVARAAPVLETADSPWAARIVAKLLAKAPSERYQTARGLEFDLTACLRGERLEALGSRDALDRFAEPMHLYGRAEAVQKLVALHAHVAAPGASKRTHFALVAGYSGVGKSALVAEMLKQVAHTGMHASGKFQQLKHQRLPYSAIAQAVSALVRQLLRGSQARLDEWRLALVEATGGEAQVLIEIAPELRAVLGRQKPLDPLPPAEAKVRFERVFLRFLATMGRPGAPLVLLLDDLQWADVASLGLIELMLTRDGVSHVLIVGAYRDNEVDSEHPLQRILERVAAPDERLTLEPLSRESVTELVRDTLRCRNGDVSAELVASVHEKTGGNPFFVRQFLVAARDAGVLRFDFEAEQWRYDVAAAARMSNTDNVVELLAGKISTLPADTQRALRTAACFGGRLRLATLVTILALPEAVVLDQLQAAITAGLVQLVGDEEVHFVHDRVQQAAYEATAVEERPSLHLRVGRLLLPTLRDDSPAQDLFAVVDHVNAAIDVDELTADRELCLEMAALNVRASERAETSSAHASALSYATFAKRLAGDKPWPELYKRLMTSEMLNGRLDESAACVAEALEVHADGDPLQRTQFLQHLVVVRTLQGDYGGGIVTAKRALALLDVHVPEPEDVEAALDAELALNQARLTGPNGENIVRQLVDSPDMTDEKWRTAVDLLQTMGPTAYIGDPLLWCFIVAKLCTICLDYGNPPDAVPSYAALGALLVTRCNRGDLGDDLAWLALSLAERYGVPLSAYITIGTCLRHWCPTTGSIRKGADDLLEAYEIAMRLNVLQHAAYCLANYSIHMFYGGLGLTALKRFVSVNLVFSREKQNGWAIAVLEGVDLALSLVADGSADDEAYCEASAAAQSTQTLTVYRTMRARALLLRGDAQGAREASALVQGDLVFVSASGSLAGAEHVFNQAMAAVGLLWERPEDEQLLAELDAAHTQLAAWNVAAPGTFGARLALVEAEQLALAAQASRSGDDAWAALRRCVAAAKRAETDEECLPVAALAHMSAARLCRALPEELGQYTGLHDAEVLRVMSQWSDSSSFAPAPEALDSDSDSAPLPPSKKEAEAAAEHEVAQEEAEQQRERAPERIQAGVLMPVLLQATGADRGLLLQQQGDDDVWFVRARAAVVSGGGEDVRVEQTSEPVTATTAPMSLVREAARLRTSLALGDTREPDHPYVGDPYWAHGESRAALCLPLSAAGSTSTVVLLENSLTPNVFTPDSIKAARALAQQVAVSMGLYSNYEDVYERTKAGLLRVLPSGAILSANPAARRLLGPDAEELKFVEGRDRKDWLGSVRATDGNSLSDFEAQIIGAGGESVWVSIQTSALRDLHGGVRVLEVALQDISVAKERAELELQRQAAKSKFLSVVAHEVRTPMNAIMCTTEVALASATDEAHLETLRSIRVAGNHLLSLLNEVLDHNKAEEGKLDLMAAPFELRRVARDIMGITECNTMHSSVKLRVDIADDVPNALVGDGKRLGQCLLNLLSNASKFTTQGSVVLSARRLGDGRRPDGQPTARLRFEVRDTGPGISADQLERVFEPYVQASARTWRNHGGTGLGLSIVRQIVTLMGGSLGVTSDGVGRGSTFWFEVELPVSSSEALEAARREDLSGGVAALRLLPAEARANTRVLIVDDSRMNLKVAVMLCKSIGFTLTEMALDGREALERVSQPPGPDSPPIDVVLMDLNMPVMDGVEATRELRARGFTLPIVGVTAASAESDVEMCMDSGMDTVAIKPLERARIEEALVQVLVRRTSSSSS